VETGATVDRILIESGHAVGVLTAGGRQWRAPSVVSDAGAQGAIYGLEATPRRFLSDALKIRTPIKGLYLSGRDVFTTGVVSAMMAGIYAAAAVEPRLFRELRKLS
jgi:phytoene dehydrogenase-like protein